MKIRLRQIEGFLALSETLSFSRAAERLGMTQAAFSQLIKELETALDLTLFHRTTRSVQLLPAAEALREQLEKGMLHIEAACRMAQAMARLEHGQLAIAALPSLACGLVLSALSRFRQRYPRIQLKLYEDHNRQILQRLEKGDVEIAIGSRAPGTERFDFELLLRDELVCVLPVGHHLARCERIDWAELIDESLILVAATSQTYVTVRESLARVTDREPQFETLNSVTAVSMVRAGLGVTLVPEINLPELNTEGLTYRPMGSPVPAREVGIFQRRVPGLSPAARAFREILLEETEIYRAQ